MAAPVQFRKPAVPLPAPPVVTFTLNTPAAGLFGIRNNFCFPLELRWTADSPGSPHKVNGTHGTSGESNRVESGALA